MTTMKHSVIAVFALISSLNTWAQSIDPPAVKAGDSWTYRYTTEIGPTGWSQTRDEVSVTRVTASAIFYTIKTSGSTRAPLESFSGRDWSRIRDVNGKETVVNRPLLFPLSPGKSWDLTYKEQAPNPEHKSEEYETRYVAVGYETIEVPAGKFRVLKIESEGHWRAVLAPNKMVTQGAQLSEQTTTLVTQVQNTEEKEATGRTYKAFWYVPEVKRWVKSVEEYYSNTGIRNARYTQELESFKAQE